MRALYCPVRAVFFNDLSLCHRWSKWFGRHRRKTLLEDVKLSPEAKSWWFYFSQLIYSILRSSTLLTGLNGKFATSSYLNIPPHFNMSLHYLVKYLCSKNRNAQEVIEANYRIRLSHSKKLFLKICLVEYSLFNTLTKRCPHQLYKNSTIDCT